MSGKKIGAEDTYGLSGPTEQRAFYDGWAPDYDRGFAEASGYIYPAEVARVFLSGPCAGPVLDVGAGTGLAAAALGDRAGPVDGIDISAEMLAVAAAKGLYRHRIVADLTGPLDIPDAAYAGFVSSGTFTHGHVGPVCLPELLRIARPGARFALGIKLTVFDEAGFGSAFARLVADRRVSPLDFVEVPIYGPVAGPEKAAERSVVAVFHRL